MATKKPAFDLPPMPGLSVAEPEATPVVEEVALSAEPVAPEVIAPPEVAPTPTIRMVSLRAARGFPIHYSRAGVVFRPDPPVTVALDPWIENQIKHGTLVEL